MDIVTKIFLTNLVIISLTAVIDGVFNLSKRGGFMQKYILNPWLLFTLGSVPFEVFNLIWG